MAGPSCAHPMTYQLCKWLLTPLGHGLAWEQLVPGSQADNLSITANQLSWLVGHWVIPGMPARSGVGVTTK